ncbi:MAG: Crp/Fnr family transcriptional regulator [Pyrinomonadaceae bacterium]|nr:Crp/Fnr family transcriptional regulator [Pyrinomonadaceae bacterium]
MPEDRAKRGEPKFPKGEHEDCQALTELTRDYLPPDGSLGVVRRYSRDASVWEPGDRSDRIYFLERGQVAILAEEKDGREILIRLVESGEPFGELCFCDGPTAYRQTTARASISARAVEIKLPDFINYLGENREALLALIFTFCVRLTDAERRIVVLAQRSAEKRLGKLLLHLAAAHLRLGKGREDEVILPLSHDQLARLAAMSRQQVTITMGNFRRQGVLHYTRGRPPAVNISALSSYLEEIS